MLVKDLTGPALNWAVAKCEGGRDLQLRSTYGTKTAWLYTMTDGEEPERMDTVYLANTPYSTDWTLGGPILQNHISKLTDLGSHRWGARCNGTYGAIGRTPLEAVCRAYIISKLGEEIVIPEELCE